MAKNLVIVESPTKARTVGRFLGRDHTVKASMGHVRDLPQKELGVHVDDGFRPKYLVLPDKRKVVKEVREAAKDAAAIYLATDPDREGEAISWHLVQAAGLPRDRVRRVVFHEITSEAIDQAFRHPRPLDEHLINAQQARRVLDRLLGYQLSPLLWQKVGGGLSAGRVQSVALRLVVEREREVRSFEPREYWSLEALLEKESQGPPQGAFSAALYGIQGERKKLVLENQAQTEAVAKDLEAATYRVAQVRKREVRRRPAPPFTTSTLQQEAGRKLRFPVKKTMLLAQQLYEGINLGDEGSVGLITYMRTDSTHLAASAVQETRALVREKYGPEYLPRSARTYITRTKGAQEAHEAIRPTSVRREPEVVRPYLTSEQYKLYDLIWKRMVACQMADAISDSTQVDIDATGTASGQGYVFRASGSVLRFPGFRAVYTEDRDDAQEEDDRSPLPELAEGEALRCQGLQMDQHFTQPPPRYTEASLVKALEERGIGRPSTYAPIISTIQERDYVRKDGGHLVPTKLGEVVNDLLVEHFPSLVDPDFTAQMEEDLDEVARGKKDWVKILKEFYGPFQEALKEAQSMPRVSVPTDEVCEKCGRPMVVKSGRYGRFLSCSGFPDCKNSRPYMARVGVACPRCGGDLVERRSRKKKTVFYGCSNYPTCNFTVGRRPVPRPCPQCGELMVVAGRAKARCTACDYQGPLEEEQQPAEVGV